MPRPRRFGKTLNLSMLQYFFEKSEVSHAYLFEHTNIWQHSAYRSLQGKFPTISLSFKDVKPFSYQKAYDHIVTLISDEFKRYRYLLSFDSIKPDEEKRFMSIVERNASETDIHESLKFLSGLLSRIYKQKVIVLIDEYDTPIHAAKVNGYYKEMVSFIRSLFSAVLKDNKELEAAFLTGILRTAKEGIFSGLNNLNIFSMLRTELGDKFGFTSQEVDDLLSQAELGERKETIKAWYNQYRCGNIALYNPWSLLKCVEENGLCKPFWVNTSDNEIIKKMIAYSDISVKTELESLLRGETISKEIIEAFVYPNIEIDTNLLWSLLFFSGYVTFKEHYVDTNGKDVCLLTIPNKEIYSVYGDLIRSIFKHSLSESKIQALKEALITADLPVFNILLTEFIENTMSTFDTSEKEPEKSYHLFVLGLLVMMSDDYEVKSNRESGYGRYAIMIIPRDRSKPGIIIEFKKSLDGEEESLEKAADKALQQIENKKYDQQLRSIGIKSNIKYGIAVKGKKIFIKMVTS